MSNLKQKLSYLMLGQQGGENRIKILERLDERSYNINQLANVLDLNYRTVKHHIRVLSNHELIECSGDGYGNVYYLTPKMEENYDILQDMKSKLKTVFESPELYKKIVEETNQGIVILDSNKDIIFLNGCFKEMIGRREEKLLGKNIGSLLRSDIPEKLEEVRKKEDGIERRMNIKTKGGEKKDVLVTMDYFNFDGDDHNRFSLLMRDITEDEKQREILKALMDHSGVTLAYLDTDFDLVYVNSAYAERAEQDPEELIGKNHFELFPDEGIENIFRNVVKNDESLEIKDKPLFDQNISDKKDPYFWTLEPVRGDGTDINGIVLSFCEHP